MANQNRKKHLKTTRPTQKCIHWSGETALNQTNQLLLVTEQGLGDTLQFMRYANALDVDPETWPTLCGLSPGLLTP